jgi:hypothetical protein
MLSVEALLQFGPLILCPRSEALARRRACVTRRNEID